MTAPRTARAPIYPARRAIERATSMPGARPVRLFALLFPVWCVEISATVCDAQPYEVLDGYLTLRDGHRYVLKEDRQKLYFDSFTCNPLPKTHYAGVTYFAEANLTGTDRTKFHTLVSLEPFRTEALTALLARSDRSDFNIPDGLQDGTARSVHTEWLPA